MKEVSNAILYNLNIYNDTWNKVGDVYADTLYNLPDATYYGDDDDILFVDIELYIGITCWNFLHFIYDTIPDYIRYLDLSKSANLKYQTYNKNKFISMFNELGISDLLNDEQLKLHNTDNIIEINLESKQPTKFKKVCFSQESVWEQRKWKLNIFNEMVENMNKKYDELHIEKTKKYYLRRKVRENTVSKFDTRRVIKQNEHLDNLNAILANNNFEEIYMEDYGKLIDKIKILSCAKIIVAEASAVGILYSFLKKRTKIIVVAGPYIIGVYPVIYESRHDVHFVISNDYSKSRPYPNCEWYLTENNVSDIKKLLE